MHFQNASRYKDSLNQLLLGLECLIKIHLNFNILILVLFAFGRWCHHPIICDCTVLTSVSVLTSASILETTPLK